MPIICQCKWPFRSYSGNKLSTGTQLLVSTEDDFNRQCFINQSTLPIQRQSYVNASGRCILTQGTRTLCWTHLLVSTEDNFTPIPTTITFPNPGQYLPIHQKSWTHLPSQCRSKANPGTMHQFYGIPVQICQFITNPSTIRQPIAADPVTI